MTGATTRREADGLLRHGQCSCAWARNSSSRDVLSKRSHTRTPAAALSLTTRHWQRAALPPGELATASAVDCGGENAWRPARTQRWPLRRGVGDDRTAAVGAASVLRGQGSGSVLQTEGLWQRCVEQVHPCHFSTGPGEGERFQQ